MDNTGSNSGRPDGVFAHAGAVGNYAYPSQGGALPMTGGAREGNNQDYRPPKPVVPEGAPDPFFDVQRGGWVAPHIWDEQRGAYVLPEGALQSVQYQPDVPASLASPAPSAPQASQTATTAPARPQPPQTGIAPVSTSLNGAGSASPQMPVYPVYDPADVDARFSAERAAVAGIDPEQAAAAERIRNTEHINARYSGEIELTGLAALDASLIDEEQILRRTRVEVFPEQPGKMTLWVIDALALDIMKIGTVQGALQTGNMGLARNALLDYFEGCVFSWNQPDPLTRATLETIRWPLAEKMWLRISQVVGANRTKKP